VPCDIEVVELSSIFTVWYD